MVVKQAILKLKQTTVAGRVPNTEQITAGELAINLTDKKLYSSDGDSVFQVAPSMAQHNAKAPIDNPNFTGDVGLPFSGIVYLPSSAGGNSIRPGTGDGASFGTYNFALHGWYGMGMADYAGNVRGVYDFRSGTWLVKGGYVVDGEWPYHLLNKTNGTSAYILGRQGGFNRWHIDFGDAELETGSNVGSNFRISRYSDNGEWIGYVVGINRNDGVFRVYNGMSVSGGSLTVDGAAVALANNVSRKFAPDPLDTGAAGTGAGDDLAALSAAQAAAGYGKPVLLTGDYLVSSYDNPYGNTYFGPGRILTSVTGGQRQRNTYADNQRLHIGHEYMNRAYQYIRLGQGSPNGTLRIDVHGDSTVQGGYGEDISSTTALTKALQAAGIPNLIVNNLGVSGTTWADLAYTPAANKGLLIIKYGINDAALGLAALMANMDAKLTSIRANANGNTTILSILLMGPNATSDSPQGRDERWYEKVRGIYVAMARKHQCAYFDTYGHFQDARGAATRFLDDPYGDGRGIHPIQAFNSVIWGAMVDEFFSRGQLAHYATNKFSNEGSTTSAVTPTTQPSLFQLGKSIYRATTAQGWPVDGFVEVTKNVDGGVRQDLWNYVAGTKVMSRTAVTASDTWNEWAGLRTAIPLSNGWVNHSASWSGPFCMKTADGVVTVEGLIAAGTTAAGTVLGTLPVGFRPAGSNIFVVATNGGYAKIQVATSGQIAAFSAVDGTFTSLSGISFAAA